MGDEQEEESAQEVFVEGRDAETTSEEFLVGRGLASGAGGAGGRGSASERGLTGRSLPSLAVASPSLFIRVYGAFLVARYSS